ncbi:AAA family ATPase, partial [Mycoplasma marinum]
MKILKIEIENFKGIFEKVSLDLSPNSNGIENDIKYGLFEQYAKPVPTSVGIIGRNSSGKSTILHAIHHVFKTITSNLFFEDSIRSHFERQVIGKYNEAMGIDKIMNEMNSIGDKIQNFKKEISQTGDKLEQVK